EGPANARSIGAQGWGDAGGEAPAQTAEVFQHTAAGPIRIRAVGKDDVNERKAVERVTTHDLGLGHGKHFGRDRVSDLVLDDLRGLAGPLSVDDDLDVGEVGDGVQRNIFDGINAAEHQCQRAQEHDELVLKREVDYCLQHGAWER